MMFQTRSSTCLSTFISFGCMTSGVLPQMVFSVKRSAAFDTRVPFLSRVHDFVKGKLFLTLECLVAHGTGVRPLGTVALPVPCQVILSLESRATDVAHESPLRRVAAQVFLQQMLVQVLGLALRTPEHGCPVRAVGYSYLAGLWLEPRGRCGRTTVDVPGRRFVLGLFPLLGFRVLDDDAAVSRVLEKVVQGERGRQMGQVVGHRRPRRSDALPRRRHAAGRLGARLPVARVGPAQVCAAQTGEILVHLKRTGSEMSANHGEVHLLEYIT